MEAKARKASWNNKTEYKYKYVTENSEIFLRDKMIIGDQSEKDLE
jgi:hypothetical protein